MKKIWISALILLVIGVCSPVLAGVRTEIRIAPTDRAHEFILELTIFDATEGGQTKIVGEPKILLIAGKEGKITVGDDKDTNQILCVAFVKETATETEVTTTITIMENGKEKTTSSHSTIVKK